MSDRAFLRLHIEAVWGIRIPPLDDTAIELSATLPLPPWSLYQARLAEDEVTIWRPGLSADERARLLQLAQNAPVASDTAPEMRREIVLRYTGSPATPSAHLQRIARIMTAADSALLEDFEAGSAAYFLDPHHAPCVGVVVAGHLVSVAHSSRRTREACELGINTIPGARRKGYAATAVRAWTSAIQAEGLVPIYSAFAGNAASLQLAAATGYIRVSASVYGTMRDDDQ